MFRSPTGADRSIYEWIRHHLVAGETGALQKPLPDEEPRSNKISWAPGAFDGTSLRHFAVGSDADVCAIAEALIEAGSTGGSKSFDALNELLIPPLSPAAMDELLEVLRRLEQAPPRLYEVALKLATQSRHRDPVKVGIAVLGLFSADNHREILLTLGRHDEFTLYSAVALANTVEDPENVLWELAKGVRGWGRIEVVQRLQKTQRSDIREWLLREGYSNSVMNEYTAYTAATTGDLVTALASPDVDDDLLRAAGEILQALIADGPAEGIDDYAEAPLAIALYLDHMHVRASTLEHLTAIQQIARFLSQDDWPERLEGGSWSEEQREDLYRRCAEIVSRPGWRAVIDQGLNSDDDSTFYLADEAARAAGDSTFEAHCRRLEADPLGSSWYQAMAQADISTIDRLLDLAERRLPLEEIASGPSDSLGLGPEFKAHSALGFILQDLRFFPGKGWALLKAGLRSPVIRNRFTVVAALAEWPRESWPDDAEDELSTAEGREPHDDLRKSIQNLLQSD